ncbi:MAG: hypothetical protein EON99_00645 [Chitinophagaceae bacterium]|nr:MAG: hypothetical protein EON99_00645 [Chitinophagaceae bacterium]
MLPKGFAVSKNEKFRNQQVLVVVEVPVGKKIELNDNLNSYNWFSVNFNRRRGFNVDWDDNWDYTYSWSTNTEYVMTANGLERTDNSSTGSRSGKSRIKADENGVEIEVDDNGGRRGQNRDQNRDQNTDQNRTPNEGNNDNKKEDDNRYRYRRDETPILDTVKQRTITSELLVPFAAFSNLL